MPDCWLLLLPWGAAAGLPNCLPRLLLMHRLLAAGDRLDEGAACCCRCLQGSGTHSRGGQLGLCIELVAQSPMTSGPVACTLCLARGPSQRSQGPLEGRGLRPGRPAGIMACPKVAWMPLPQ